jgi:hypothetical protein
VTDGPGRDVGSTPDDRHHVRMALDVDTPPASTRRVRGRRRERRRVDRALLAASAAIALGIVVIGFGIVVSVTGDERTRLPDEVQEITPAPDAVQTLSQSSVIVDLVDGYTGVLVLDGVELETVNLDEIGSIDVEPGKQVDLPPVTVFEPGNATLTFTPTEGALVEEFESGLHRAEVVYWRVDEGRQRAASFRWTFNVV